jgi:hypothetical protein
LQKQIDKIDFIKHKHLYKNSYGYIK